VATAAKKQAMTLRATLAKLEALGDAKVRARNRKLGAGERQYGVRLGEIRKLAAAIRGGHELALELWTTGNVDARLLAILLFDPQRLTRAELDRLVRSGDFGQIADWLNAYVVKEHPESEPLRVEWMAADDPWAARAGWSLTAGRVARRPQGLDLAALLARIESEMATAAPEVQWTMNSCLAAIGIHYPEHRARAVAIGESLGIYRDFPVSKGCTSPFAPIWIAEMVRRQG
jgi:3-methyladenine DNA glycosylase AlkD